MHHGTLAAAFFAPSSAAWVSGHAFILMLYATGLRRWHAGRPPAPAAHVVAHAESRHSKAHGRIGCQLTSAALQRAALASTTPKSPGCGAVRGLSLHRGKVAAPNVKHSRGSTLRRPTGPCLLAAARLNARCMQILGKP